MESPKIIPISWISSIHKNDRRLFQNKIAGSSDHLTLTPLWRRGGLVVSALAPESSGPGSRPDRGHCVVFSDKALYSHSASLHPGV